MVLESSELVGVPVHDSWAKVFISGNDDECGAGSEFLQEMSLLGSEVVLASLFHRQGCKYKFLFEPVECIFY